MSRHHAERAETIAGTPEACFAAVCDFVSYPAWQSAVRAVEVRTIDDAGAVVAFVVDARVRHIRYVLRYGFHPPDRIDWTLVEGDVRAVEGDYVFEDLGDGTTRATYRLAIDPGRFVPGPVRSLLTDTVMRGSVRELKERVEGS